MRKVAMSVSFDPIPRPPGEPRRIDPSSDDWSAVTVDAIDVLRSVPGKAPGVGLVCACVYLGRIRPADVRVELRCEACGGSIATALRPTRMWSMHAQEPGTYYFEAYVPEDHLACADRITVSAKACPGGGERDEPLQPPVARRSQAIAMREE